MTRFRLILPLILAALASLFVTAAAARQPLQFRDFPGEQPEGSAPHALPDLSTRDAWNFRTRLRQAAADPANFSGHYRLAVWGCGTSCAQGAVVDHLTGRVVFLPFSICCSSRLGDVDFDPVVFRPQSNLVIFAGKRNDQDEDAVHFYRFTGSGFVYIESRPYATDYTSFPHIKDSNSGALTAAHADAIPSFYNINITLSEDNPPIIFITTDLPDEVNITGMVTGTPPICTPNCAYALRGSTYVWHGGIALQIDSSNDVNPNFLPLKPNLYKIHLVASSKEILFEKEIKFIIPVSGRAFIPSSSVGNISMAADDNLTMPDNNETNLDSKSYSLSELRAFCDTDQPKCGQILSQFYRTTLGLQNEAGTHILCPKGPVTARQLKEYFALVSAASNGEGSNLPASIGAISAFQQFMPCDKK